MFTGLGAVDDEKTKTIENIITLVRAAQKNKIPIDYDGIISGLMVRGPNNPEVAEVKTLLDSLRKTNPY
jgi:trehalose-6-phosphatase